MSERSLCKLCARTGLAGVCCFTVAVLLMHLIQPELSPLNDAVSYYMNGRLGWMLGFGLIATGAGSVALVWALRRFPSPAKVRVGLWCLALWGAGALVGGIFPPDPRGHWDLPPSARGMIHGSVAMVAFLALPVAAMLLSGPIGKVSGSHLFTRWLNGLASTSVITLVAFFVCLAPAFRHHAPHFLGLAERVLLAAYIGWLVTASVAAGRAASADGFVARIGI